MKIQHTIIFTILVISCLALSAHSGKARYHVIIETNFSPNDARTISLLLASKEVEVIGVYCTDEIIPDAIDIEADVLKMLTEYHHEGIPVGQSAEFLRHLYVSEEEKITYICLTTLRSVSNEICRDIDMINKTEQVIWHNDDYPFDSGFSHTFFPEDYMKVYESGIKLIHTSNSLDRVPLFSKKFQKKVSREKTRYIQYLSEDFLLSEELTAFYLSDTSLLHAEESLLFPGHKVFRLSDPKNATAVYLELLQEKKPDYKILSHIPLEAEYYQDDITPFIDSVLLQYGGSELRAGVLCFELHGHIGIYAIIGVKMGIRVREYFNIGLDDLMVVSYTGKNPPFSCLNDGLQVSTGSTLGHGLIEVREIINPAVSASFSFKSQTIEISLRPEIAIQIRKDIQNGISRYGNLTPEYWAFIRELAIRYWIEFDRNVIFNISKI